MCGGDADLATEILKTQTETGVTQFHTCDECHRYCYTGGDLYPDGFTCTDCDDDVSDDDENDECDICSGRFCIDDMEVLGWFGDLLACPECYEIELAKYKKELAKKNEPITINAATLKMYQFTDDQFDGLDDDHHLDIDADSVREYWLKMLQDHSDCFDIEWFALIATPAIEKTINWNFIARKYQEKRIFQVEHLFAE
jgi:hypothetical protein